MIVFINSASGIIVERKSFMLLSIFDPVPKHILTIMQLGLYSILVLFVTPIFHIKRFRNINGNNLIRVEALPLRSFICIVLVEYVLH